MCLLQVHGLLNSSQQIPQSRRVADRTISESIPTTTTKIKWVDKKEERSYLEKDSFFFSSGNNNFPPHFLLVNNTLGKASTALYSALSAIKQVIK